jgi:hypothetical protein
MNGDQTLSYFLPSARYLLDTFINSFYLHDKPIKSVLPLSPFNRRLGHTEITEVIL